MLSNAYHPHFCIVKVQKHFNAHDMIRYLFNTIVFVLLLTTCSTSGFAQCLNWLTPNNTPIVGSDITNNNSELWNDPWFEDPNSGSFNDLAEGTVPAFTLEQTCGSSVNFNFVLRLDLDNNGSQESVVTLLNQAVNGSIWYDNVNDINYMGQNSAVFDARPVPNDQKYRIGVAATGANEVKLVFYTAAAPTVYTDAQLPYGNHVLELSAFNNIDSIARTYNIRIEDHQAPTVVCLNGISTNIMQTGSIQMWASDFLQYTEDNYSTTPTIALAVRKAGTGTGFPVNSAGAPIDNLIYDCSEIGENLVELWAKDHYGNASFCQVVLYVTDNFNVCDPILSLEYTAAATCEDDNYLWAVVNGGVTPIQYQWSNGSTDAFLNNIGNGTYTVTVTDGQLTVLTASYTVTGVPSACSLLKGIVVKDSDANCQFGSTDTPLANNTVLLQDAGNNQYFVQTDANGRFQKRLSPGTYQVSFVDNSGLWTACNPNLIVVVPTNDTVEANVVLQANYSCPAMTVEVLAPYLSSCSNNNYWIQYCNEGTENAVGAYVDIEFDSYLVVLSSSVPYTLMSGNTYRFNVGDVALGQCGTFNVLAFLSCQSVNGQSHCVSATAYPPGDCLPPNAQWSGASIAVNAVCDNDSLRFEIKNVGSGDMTESVRYIVIEDLVMVHEGQVGPLNAGFSMPIAVPYNGSTWRIEVEQEAFHPGASKPALSVEACNGNVFTTGISNQFYLDEGNPWEDSECVENNNTFLTNGKDAYPVGYGPDHLITPETQLTYTIRYLNTTNDTVQTIIVRDTLSEWLDPATVALSGSYAPFGFNFEGNGPNLKFTFENVYIPPVNPVNPFSSFGWVSFSVKPKTTAPLGTNILNTAHIQFDNSALITTNTVQHRIEEDFIAKATSGTTPDWSAAADLLQISPNPASDVLYVSHKGNPAPSGSYYVIRNVEGKTMAMLPASTNEQQPINVAHLTAGVYTVQHWNQNKMVTTKTFIKQ